MDRAPQVAAGRRRSPQGIVRVVLLLLPAFACAERLGPVSEPAIAELRPSLGQAVSQQRRPRHNIPARDLSNRVLRPSDASLRDDIRKSRGNVLIGLKSPAAARAWESGRLAAISVEEIDEGFKVLDSLGVQVTGSFAFRPIVTATLRPGQLERLLSSAHVDYVEPNLEAAPQGRSIRIRSAARTSLQSWPQDTTWGIHRVGAPSAWSQNQGQWANVTILDSGLDLTHMTTGDGPASLANCVYVPMFNDLPGCTVGPLTSHGVMVSGIVASSDNSIGGIGVAPILGQLNSVRVCRRTATDNGCPVASVIWGLEWAMDQNLARHIVNISLGYCTNPIALQSAIQDAADSGILVVAAAGNRWLNDPDCDKQTNNISISAVKFPAAYPSVLAVGGSMYASNGVPPLANRPEVGGGDGGTVGCDPIQDPDGCDDFVPPPTPSDSASEPQGFSTIVMSDSACLGYGSRHGPEVALVAPFWSKTTVAGGGYGAGCGTSYSAPIVTGVAALVWSRHTGYTAAQVRSHLLATAISLSGGRRLAYAGLELPSLSVGMGGPQEIDTEGTYTWTATPPAHWPNPISYVWHYSESSSGPWDWGGSGLSYFRYVTASSPAGFWIRLTASSGTAQATSLRFVSNTAVNPCYPYDCE